MSIANHISNLLHNHKCVIVPDLGGFLVNDAPARLHSLTQVLSPPTSQLAFNKNLINSDGLLLNELMQRENVDYHTAELMVARFVKEARHFLKQNKSYIIPKIGKIYVDEEANLQFIPDTRINYRSDSFGLPAIPVTTITRQKTVQVKERNFVVTQGNKTIQRIPMYAAAAVMALLVSFGGLFLLSGVNSSAGNIMAGITASFEDALNNTEHSIPAVPEDVVIKTPATVNYLPISPSISAEAFETPEAEPVLVAQPIVEEAGKSYYHIVVGMFTESENAFKMEQKSIAKGYTPVTKHGRKYHRVMVKFARQDDPVRSTLRTIKTELEPGAWVWETRNR